MSTRTLLALGLTAALAAPIAGAGCKSGNPEASAKAMEERMRDIEKRMKDSMPKTQEIAITQKADPALVKRAQVALGALKEYLDPPSGKMDMVTVNAIEAFQGREGREQNGLLSEELVKRMEKAAKTAAPG